MKKFSFMLLLVALLTTTLFVFANNRKFANSLDIYADKGGGVYIQISDGPQSFLELSTSPGSGSPAQAAMTDRSGQTYPLVEGASKSPVYSVSTW